MFDVPMRTRTFDGVTVQVYGSVEEIVAAAAEMLFEQLKRKRNSILGLATGSTFIPFYDFVATHFRPRGLSFSEVVTFNLDEYYPMPAESPDSYHSFMKEHLFSRIDMSESSTHIPDGSSADPEVEARLYEESIGLAGGIDLQFLGLGRNGHIGFNEPGTSFGSRTHVTTLSCSTLAANAPLFSVPSSIPDRALTMGIGTILDARAIILLAYGGVKAEAVARSLKEDVSESVPASALRRHRNAILMIDDDAAAALF